MESYHKLEIKAVSLAKSGGNYLEFEKILLKQKSIAAELKYLLPTIPGLCPADISSTGIGKLLTEVTGHSKLQRTDNRGQRPVNEPG